MARIRGFRGSRTRLIVRLLSFSLVVSLAPLSFIQEVSAAPIPVADCKLFDPFKGSVRLGFPKNTARLNATGTQKILLMAVDYSDAPTTDNATEALKLAFDTEKVSDFFKSVSYGQLSFTYDYFPKVVRLPNPSSNYTNKLANPNPPNLDVYKVMQDAATSISGQVNFSSYQAIAILDLGKIDGWGSWGFALPYEFPGFATTTGYIKNATVMSSWPRGFGTPKSSYKTKTLIHELGHLFGFIDLYIIAPGNLFIGQTPGHFDIMNGAGEFLSWQRWLQGWIPDSNVTCLSFSDPSGVFQLKPLGKATSGTQMSVIRMSEQKALVLESRKGTSNDDLGGNEGLLAYEIDLSIPTLHGPIRIIPRNTPATLAAISPNFSDFERFQEAPAQTGHYIRYKDILIENKLSNQDGESIQIYKGNAASERQRDLDAIDRNNLIKEFNRIQTAKAKNTYYESPICIDRNQKFSFQTLDEKRVWKDYAGQIGFTTDPTCNSPRMVKPYVIAELPSRTFYRGKISASEFSNETYTAVFLTDALPLTDKTQLDLEIALAKLESNFYLDTSTCVSRGFTGTFQIERDGVFMDFPALVSWVPGQNCGFANALQASAIARLATGTKYRFKSQFPGSQQEFLSPVYTKGKTVPELLAEVTQKSAELNALNSTLGKEKAALEAQASSLIQQIANAKSEIGKLNTTKAALDNELNAITNKFRIEKTELEGSVATLRSQLVTSNSEIEQLQRTLSDEKNNFVFVTGELITAKTKLEGDVVILQKENTTLKAKVESLSKTTITCVKGTTKRKVTAVKPSCPAGFKKS
jgi:M6 family metalloprotease-like protein